MASPQDGEAPGLLSVPRAYNAADVERMKRLLREKDQELTRLREEQAALLAAQLEEKEYQVRREMAAEIKSRLARGEGEEGQVEAMLEALKKSYDLMAEQLRAQMEAMRQEKEIAVLELRRQLAELDEENSQLQYKVAFLTGRRGRGAA